MSRIDWKRGRFNSDFETNEINQALRAYQSAQIADSVNYYRFDRADSVMDDVYDEGDGVGKVYHPSVVVPALHVTHEEGLNEDTDSGFYFNDNIYVTASFDQIVRTGLTFIDLKHENYLKDRIEYDGLIFRVTSIQILGQIRQRDVIVSIEGTQVKPDELVNDPQFKNWSA